MKLDDYPLFKSVCLEMALANNGIRRDRSESDFYAAVKEFIGPFCTDEEMVDIERFLGTLTLEEKRELADGEHNASQAILARDPAGENLDRYLDIVFNDVI